MKFQKPWSPSLNQSSLFPNENCALMFCLFEEPGCSLHRPRSSEEHASRALVVIPNWAKHQNHKSSGLEIGLISLCQNGLPYETQSFHFGFLSSILTLKIFMSVTLCFFIESPFSSSLFSTLSWNIWDHSITLPLPNLIISLGAFFGTPFSWFNLPCGEGTEIMMPTQPCIYALLW